MKAYELIVFLIDSLGQVESTEKLGKIICLLMCKFSDLTDIWLDYEWGALGPWCRDLPSVVEMLRQGDLIRRGATDQETESFVLSGTMKAGEVAEEFEIRLRQSTEMAQLATLLNEQSVEVLRQAAAVAYACIVWHQPLTKAKWTAINALRDVDRLAIELLWETGILEQKEQPQGGDE